MIVTSRQQCTRVPTPPLLLQHRAVPVLRNLATLVDSNNNNLMSLILWLRLLWSYVLRSDTENEHPAQRCLGVASCHTAGWGTLVWSLAGRRRRLSSTGWEVNEKAEAQGTRRAALGLSSCLPCTAGQSGRSFVTLCAGGHIARKPLHAKRGMLVEHRSWNNRNSVHTLEQHLTCIYFGYQNGSLTKIHLYSHCDIKPRSMTAKHGKQHLHTVT